MSRPLAKLLFLLPRPLHFQAAFLLLVSIVNAGVQMLSIASILPFLAVLSDPGQVESNRFLNAAYRELGFTDPNQLLVLLGIVLFVALLTSIAVKGLHFYLTNRFGNDCEFAMSHRLMTRYLRRDYSYFLGQNSSRLAKNTFSEVGEVVRSVLKPGICLVAESITAVMILVLLVFANPPVALVLAAVLGTAYGLIYLGIRRRLGALGEEKMNANRRRFYAASEAYGGIKDVKLLGREDIYTERFAVPAKIYARMQTRIVFLQTIPKYSLEAFAFGGMMAVALYFMRTPEQVHHALPLLGMYAFAGYRLMPILQSIFSNLASVRAVSPVVDHLCEELAGLESPERPAPRSSERMPLVRSIEFHQVGFTYPNSSEPVIRNLTLQIAARSKVGFVGSSGAGKSTLVDILLGLLHPDTGALKIDGLPVTRENLRLWQNALGYVSQHIYLADDTIARNIAFGVPDEKVDHARVRHCARIARLDDFIEGELPDAYQAIVGERGVRLSGGQRQRIGIARALYPDPDVLILDEATSALDNLTEAEVMNGINSLDGEKTVIMIAHRLTTLRDCASIHHLENGAIVASGGYEELLGSDERFRNMAAAAHPG